MSLPSAQRESTPVGRPTAVPKAARIAVQSAEVTQ